MQKNDNISLFKNFSNFSITTLHKRKRFGQVRYYLLYNILLDIRVPSQEKEALIKMFTRNE